MDIINTEDPSIENFPRPFVPKVKMQGNNMALNNPIDVTAQIETVPEVKIEKITNIVAIAEQKPMAFLGLTFNKMKAPTNLPIMASPQ